MNHYNYTQKLKDVWTKACSLYEAGNSDHSCYFTQDERDFINNIGIHSQEVFDFVEDFVDRGEPDFTTFAIIHDIRRNYFINVQKKKRSAFTLKPDMLPGRDEALGGYRWLPRIIAKANGKLRGELDPDIMYCCSGDRSFLKEHDIHPGEFLHIVWKHSGDNEPIAKWIEDRQ